jgi:hypothetical protein
VKKTGGWRRSRRRRKSDAGVGEDGRVEEDNVEKKATDEE